MRAGIRRFVRFGIAVTFVVGAFVKSDGEVHAARAGAFPMCSEACNDGAACEEDCEIGTEFGWIFTTCGEYENGWDGGFCEVPEDVWDTHVEPLVSNPVEFSVPTSETDPLIDTWADAADEIATAFPNGIQGYEDLETVFDILYSHNLIDASLDEYFEEAELVPSELGAAGLSSVLDSPDGSGAAPKKGRMLRGTCGQKWTKIGKAALVYGAIGAGASFLAAAWTYAPALSHIWAPAAELLVDAAITNTVYLHVVVYTPCYN